MRASQKLTKPYYTINFKTIFFLNQSNLFLCFQIIIEYMFTGIFLLIISMVSPINSLAPERFGWNLKHIISRYIFVNDILSVLFKLQLPSGADDQIGDRLMLVTIMILCLYTTCYYLHQRWPRSAVLYEVIIPQPINCCCFSDMLQTLYIPQMNGDKLFCLIVRRFRTKDVLCDYYYSFLLSSRKYV